MSLTKEQLDKIKYLGYYTYLLKELDNKIEEFNSWNDRILNISPSYSNQPKSQGSKDKISTGIVAIEEIQSNLNNDILKIKEKKEDIEKIIDSVDNDVLKNILLMRYINGKRFEDIAYECNYSWRHTRRLHIAAIDSINIENMSSNVL